MEKKKKKKCRPGADVQRCQNVCKNEQILTEAAATLDCWEGWCAGEGGGGELGSDVESALL